MGSNPVKICVVGPQRAGKTFLCRILSETVSTSGAYRPTVGCRIQPVERGLLGSRSVQLELWDCSSDEKIHPFFPALQNGLHGLLLVLDASQPAQEAELHKWFTAFTGATGLAPRQCLVVALHPSKGGAQRPPELTSLSALNMVSAVLPETAEDAKATAEALWTDMSSWLQAAVEAKDQQDESTLGLLGTR